MATEERRWDEAAGLSLDVVADAARQEHTRGQRRREERPAMDHIGIDVHKRESQICPLAEGGELIERRIRTEPERFLVSPAVTAVPPTFPDTASYYLRSSR